MLGMERKQIIPGLVLVAVLIFGAGYKTAQVREKANLKPVVAVNSPDSQEKAKSRTVTVYITGAVKKPGVYTFPEGSRVTEAVYKAGPAKDAELSYLNLAEIMTDQQPILVPRQGEEIPDGSGLSGSGLTGRGLSGSSPGLAGAGKGFQAGKINLNTANAAALDRLPGIGPALAQRIIEYRKEHGKFKNISELLQVSGIGQKKFDELKDRITI